MAITVVNNYVERHIPDFMTVTRLSTLDAGLGVDQAHVGPSGCTPYKVDMSVITQPTDGSDVRFKHDKDNDSGAGNTIRIVFDTEAGGSLTGAVVEIYSYFAAAGSGGIG